MIGANYIEIEVGALLRLSDEEGAVMMQERFQRHGAPRRRFLLGFSHCLMQYMKAARDHFQQHGELVGHGAVIRFFEDQCDVRLDHVTIYDYDQQEGRYLTACHGTTPDGEFSKNILPSDALAMGMFAGVSFWMDDLLFLQAVERCALNVAALEARDAFNQANRRSTELEDIPESDIPKA